MPGYDDESGRPQRDPYQDKLRSLAERIQVGDTDEGAAALQELLEHARTSGGGMRRAVQQELAAMRLQQETNAALGKFAKKYADKRQRGRNARHHPAAADHSHQAASRAQ